MQKYDSSTSYKYTLVTENGKVMKFHIKGLAELYRSIEGGTLTSHAQNGVHKT